MRRRESVVSGYARDFVKREAVLRLYFLYSVTGGKVLPKLIRQEAQSGRNHKRAHVYQNANEQQLVLA
jgi:hypothetical protein